MVHQEKKKGFKWIVTESKEVFLRMNFPPSDSGKSQNPTTFGLDVS